MSEKEKISPVVKSGKAKVKKPSTASKFAKMFLSEDARSTKDYVIEDVLVPKAKDLITSILKSIVDTLFYGRGGGGSSSRSNSSYVSYRDYGSSRKEERRSGTYRSQPMFSDIIFDNPQDATEVLARMEEIIDRYRIATVGNLYDLAGLKVPFTAENYGWADFKNAKVVKTADGFVIKTPPCMPID